MAYFSLKTFSGISYSVPSLAKLYGPWTIHRCIFRLQNGNIKLTPTKEPMAKFNAVDIRMSSGTSSLSGFHFASAVEMLMQQWESMSTPEDKYPVVFFEGVPVDARKPIVVEYCFSDSEKQADTLCQILRFQSSAETTKIVKTIAPRDNGLSWERIHHHFRLFYQNALTETLASVVRHLKFYCQDAAFDDKVVVVDEGTSFSMFKYSDLQHQTANPIIPDIVDGNVVGITLRGLKAAAGTKSIRKVYSYASTAQLHLACYSADGRVFILVSSNSPSQKSLEIRGIRADDVGTAYFSPSASHLVLCSSDYAKVTVCDLSEIDQPVVTIRRYFLSWNPVYVGVLGVSLTDPHPSSGVVSIWFIPEGYAVGPHSFDPHHDSLKLPCQVIRHFPSNWNSMGYIRQQCSVEEISL